MNDRRKTLVKRDGRGSERKKKNTDKRKLRKKGKHSRYIFLTYTRGTRRRKDESKKNSQKTK